MPDDRALARLAWLAPVALAAVVWFPLTGSYFHFDDFLDLYQLRNDDAARYFLRMYGGHLLLARHAVTALLDAAFGPAPLPYFVVVLVTHLVNTGLLYALALRLTGSWRLAVVAAAVWGAAPANEGALGWYAVYGQVAATTCILVVLVGLARAASIGTPGSAPAGWAAPLRWAGLMLLAGMFFGVGIAAALAMPAVAWLLLPRGTSRRQAIGCLAAAALALLATYALLRALEMPVYGEQRIEITFMLAGLTPAAVGDHLRLFGALFGFGLAALPFGPLTDLNAFPTQAQVVALVLGGLLLAAGLATGSAAQRRRLFACLVLVAAIYGLIAVARSMFIDLGLAVLARSLRYHYAAGALLSAALALALAALASRLRLSRRAGSVAFAAWLAATAATEVAGARRLNHFVGDRRETERVLAEIQAAVAAAPPGATVQIPNRQFGAVGYINVGYTDRFPGTAAVFVIFHPHDVIDGRRVVFTTSDPLALAGARRGRRSAALLRELPALPPAAKAPPP